MTSCNVIQHKHKQSDIVYAMKQDTCLCVTILNRHEIMLRARRLEPKKALTNTSTGFMYMYACVCLIYDSALSRYFKADACGNMCEHWTDLGRTNLMIDTLSLPFP